MPHPRTLVALGAVLAVGGIAAPVGASASSDEAVKLPPSATGHYQGETFQMADGIPDNASCAVTAVDEAWCFATAEEMYASGLVEAPFGAALSESSEASFARSDGGPVAEASGAFTCSSTGSLNLYEDINYGGSVLSFGYNFANGDYYLGSYGWNDRAESYKNSNCGGRIGFDDYPAGSTYIVFWGGYQLDTMGSWNNRVSTMRW
jgi:hypothetical protein